MNIKIGSIFSIAIWTLGLSGCYIFDKLPFQESELKNFSETVFIEEIWEIAQRDVPEEARQMLEEFSQENPDDLVYAISDDFVLFFEKKEIGWHPHILMKNDSHFMICEIVVDEDTKAPEGVKVELQEQGEEIDPEEMFPATIVSGTEEGMKKFLLDLSSSSPKVCLAIPVDAMDDPFPDSDRDDEPETSTPDIEAQ